MFIRTKISNSTALGSTTLIALIGLLVYSPAKALNVTSGVFIQTVIPGVFEDSLQLTVNDFFDAEAASSRLREDFVDLSKFVLGPPPLPTNTFVYAVNSPSHRIPNRTSLPSDFSYDPDNLAGTAEGQIGLGGVMRFDLPQNRLFIMGDWTIEYDESRKEHGGSGWFMRNWFDFPLISFDIVNANFIGGADSFFLSGSMGWSPEFTEGFAASLADTETLRAVADFVMCAQDDEALTASPAQQIPCVFPNIKVGGQTGIVNVGSAQSISLEADLGFASETPYPAADYFVAFVYESELYWLNPQFEWTKTPAPAYQGPLVNFKGIALPSLPFAFPAGTTIPVYFAVDATQNGTFDEPYRFSVVNIQIN